MQARYAINNYFFRDFDLKDWSFVRFLKNKNDTESFLQKKTQE